MHRLTCSFALTALLLQTSAVASDVWTVSNVNPGVDFTQIQAAVNAAADGDVILIVGGDGYAAVTIDNKALTVVVDNGLTVYAYGMEVINLPANKQVTLAGLKAQLLVRDCAGDVLVQDWRSLAGWNSQLPGGEIVNCANVTLVNSEFRGRYGGEGEDGGTALQVSGSDVALYSCELQGGWGGDANCLSFGGGDGGDALVIQNHSNVHATDSTFQFGLGGLSCGMNDGAHGEDIVIDGTSQFTEQTMPITRMSTPRVVREGETYAVHMVGPPGDFAYLLSSSLPQYRVFNPAVGILHLASPFALSLLGAITANGTLTVHFTAPNLGGNDESRQQYVQSYLSAGGGRYLTRPQVLIVVDSTL